LIKREGGVGTPRKNRSIEKVASLRDDFESSELREST
jgi:hypothetical protein